MMNATSATPMSPNNGSVTSTSSGRGTSVEPTMGEIETAHTKVEETSETSTSFPAMTTTTMPTSKQGTTSKPKKVALVTSFDLSGKTVTVHEGHSAVEAGMSQPEWPQTKIVSVYVVKNCNLQLTDMDGKIATYHPTTEGTVEYPIEGIRDASGSCN
ncbi:hypothetical protein PFISCL1PPCAC_3298 [Pristionchus fissidentatus]|uniref:Uncharacterized protein n=1 Tax=Pristionchus fissidentatus TaxID=1538716 RepID=A0AAV5UXJ7_9BILA|nr:hypothetical protein PFISCL1PPCAC_3298 [Pristionchus fissidentatus]